MLNQPDILKDIVAEKWIEIEQRQKSAPLSDITKEINKDVRGFRAAMQSRIEREQCAVIAEIKKASPSKGIIRENFDPVAIAKDYESSGAACISVLTDERFFKGCDRFLVEARDAIALPVLRKDFVVDPYQIYEARMIGADCILLIVSILEQNQLKELNDLALSLGMDVLVEVHDEAELERALEISPGLLGINNRNLRTFEVNIDTTVRLLNMVPGETLVITESGIVDRSDVDMMVDHRVYGFLVGESFMREDSPGRKLEALFVR